MIQPLSGIDIAQPTVEEFLQTPWDKRRGCLAALVTAAMVDHFFEARPNVKSQYKRVAKFRESIWNKRVNNYKNPGECMAVDVLNDVANATKHVSNKEKRGNNIHGRMGYKNIISTPLNVCGVMQCGWPISSYPEVVVGENFEWRLVDLLEMATIFWKKKLFID